jgi:hypothetical protein
VRPLNLGETLDASIKIVRARWRTLATATLVVAVPIAIATVAIISATTDVYEVGSEQWLGGATDGATTYADDGAFVGGQVAILALAFLGNLLGTVVCFRAVAEQAQGRAVSVAETLRFARERLGPGFELSGLVLAGVFLGLVAFVVPGVWLAVAWAVALPVMLVEGVTGVGALSRSQRLVQGRWWATAGRLLVASILSGVLSSVVSAVFLSIAGAVVDDTSFVALVVQAAATLVSSLVTVPFFAAVATVVYLDLRARKEGFDLAALAEATGAAAPPRPAPRAAERDAFGNPVVPRAPAPQPKPAPPRPGDVGPERAAPEGWAPPRPPEARPRPLWDPGPDPEGGEDR